MNIERILYLDFEIHSKTNDYTLRPIIDAIKKYDKDIVIFGNQTEYRLGWYECYLNFGKQFMRDELFDELENVLQQKNAQFYLIVGSHHNEVFSHFTTYPIKNFHVLYWSTCLFSHTYKNLHKEYSTQRINKQFNHLFIVYNNKTRFHRREIMDELCKRDLLKDNLYSWVESGRFQHGYENLGGGVEYELKCFEDKKVMLDNFDYLNGREFTSNLLNMNCLINIVTESDVQAMFITEKTYRQLMIGQPFLSLCAKDTHKTLKEYGFELYDEIFDYSFDNDPNYKNRIKGIIDNVENLKNENFTEVYKKIEDKVEHNVRQSNKIFLGSFLTPNLILDLTKSFFPDKSIHSITDSDRMFGLLRNQMDWYIQ
jgi:hypothetical protein